MQKKAIEFKKGDSIVLDNELCVVGNIETSDIGKHGKVKVRIEAVTKKKERKVAIFLADEDIKIK